MTLQRCTMTIPVSLEQDFADGVAQEILRAHATARGVPPDVKPVRTETTRTHVAEYTYEWLAITDLPTGDQYPPHSMYCWKARRVSVLRRGGTDPIHLVGWGYLTADQAESVALELLAASQQARKNQDDPTV